MDGGRGRRRFARCWSVLPAAFAALVLATASASLLVGTTPAGAIGNGDFAMAPTTPRDTPSRRTDFTPILSPGQAAKDSVTVANLTQKPLKLDLYAADAYTSRSGGFAIQANFKPKVHMGAWIHFPVTTLTLAPRTAEIVPFTYLAPANVSPGDYAGGIVVVQPTGKFSTKGQVRVQALQAIGVAVYGTVPGPLHPKLAVTAVSLTTTSSFGSQFGGPVGATVTYSVTNTGNKFISPVVTVSLSPLIGSGPKFQEKLPQILPGSTVTFRHTFDSVTPFGSLTANVTAQGTGAKATGSSTAVVIPWGLVAIVVILIVLVIVLVRRRRRPKPGRDYAAPGTAAPGSGGATPEPPSAPVGTGPSARGP